MEEIEWSEEIKESKGGDIDIYEGKVERRIRIGFVNINGIPQSSNHPKNKLIQEFLLNAEIDIMGFVETNVKWNMLKGSDSLQERTLGWWQLQKAICANNTQDVLTTSSAYQQGGSAILTNNRVAERIISSGKDSSGMGRWTWVRVRGSSNLTTRIICAYCPRKPSTSTTTTDSPKRGLSMIYAQQQRVMQEEDDNRCPREATIEELFKNIKEWQTKDKDNIILMMDANEDINNLSFQQNLSKLQLREIIHESHSYLKTWPTFHRGSKPIDGIFATPHIKSVASGYCPFSYTPSDHRMLWLDIEYDNSFGTTKNLPI